MHHKQSSDPKGAEMPEIEQHLRPSTDSQQLERGMPIKKYQIQMMVNQKQGVLKQEKTIIRVRTKGAPKWWIVLKEFIVI